jgi:hypothetical protein
MTRSIAVVLATATVAALAHAASALGATPFSAGIGTGHDLAVGSDGTGHVVWIRDDGVEDEVPYCRVPLGASGCAAGSTTLEFPDTSLVSDPDSFGTAHVFAPAPNKVVVVASCTQCGVGGLPDRTYMWVSTDNGASFPTVVQMGADIMVGGQTGFMTSGGVDVVLGVEGGLFMGMDFPIIESADFSLGGGGGFVFNPAVVPGPDSSTVVHAIDDLHAVKYAVFTDPATAGITPSELNNPSNWTSKLLSAPEGENSETHLSSGGNGVLLSYRYFVPNDNRIALRRFDAATDTFGPPLYVEGTNSIDNNSADMPHHSQDGSGRIHVVWRSLHGGGRLRYTRSDDGGVSFSQVANLATSESFQDPIVEASPAGGGYAVWSGSGTSTIRVVPIDPMFEADPAAGGGPGGGPGGGGPGGGSDTTDPSVGGFSAGSSTLTSGAGTTFTFNSSEPGRATLSFHKRVKGLKVRRRGRQRCVPQTRARLRRLRRSAGSRAAYRRLLRQRRCKAWKKVGQIRREVLAGRNEIEWNGRVAGRRLSPGLYQARLRIIDGAGNVSRTERLRFRVKRRR